MERFFPTFRKTLVLSLCLIVVEAFSQEFSAGINTESPNPNAVLHLVSPNGNQGLMLPKLTNGQRNAMALTQSDNGLLVYDSDDNVMYYWLNTGWRRFSTRDELVLELVNNQLSLQNGNSVDLSDYLDNTDDQTANEVTFDNSNTNYTSTTVQGALGEIYTILVGADLTDDQTAVDVPYDNATSGLAASDLQGAVDEISANMTAAGLTDDQLATEVPYDNATSGLVAADVQGAIDELASGGVTDTDDQTLSLTASNLSISEGNMVDLSGLTSMTFFDYNPMGLKRLRIQFPGGTPQFADLSELDKSFSDLLTSSNDAGGLSISNVGDPTAAQDVATKNYVDSQVIGTDDQTLSLAGTTLSIFDGNSVDLSSINTDNQNAASVPFTPDAGLTSTDVQAAILEVQGNIGASSGDMLQATYDANTDGTVDNAATVGGLTVQTAVPAGAVFTDSQAASAVPVTPAGNLAATDVQAALVELQTDIDGIAVTDTDDQTLSLAGTTLTIVDGNSVDLSTAFTDTDDQSAAEVTVTPTGNLTANDVQAALVELQTDIDGATGDMQQATYDANADGTVDDAASLNGATVGTGANQIVQLDGVGALPAVDGSNLTGIATTNFSGALTGDVTGTQGATVVSIVGGETAANVAAATAAVNGATSLDTDATDDITTADVGTAANQIVQLDGAGALPAVDGSNLTGITTTNFSGALTGDVTGTQGATVVSNVGGETAANVAAATAVVNGATSLDTDATDDITTADVGTGANQIVQLDGAGALPAVDGSNLTGITTTNFSGALTGDVTGTQGATVVSNVGGETAANVAAATAAVNGATSLDTDATDDITTADVGTGANQIVQLDGAGALPAVDGSNLTGITTTNFSGALTGDVTGTQGATVVSNVGGETAANVAAATAAVNGATSLDTDATDDITTADVGTGANQIVQLDGAGALPAVDGSNLTGITTTNFSGALTGDVTGTQGATVVSNVGGETAANVASATAIVNGATALDTDATDDLTNTTTPAAGDISGDFAGGLNITAGAIVDADISSGAAIAGSKVNPNFGAQDIIAQSIDIGPGVANIDNLGNGGISNNLTVGNNLSVSGTINANANIDIGPGNMSIDNSGNVATTGTVSATSFSGDGSGLTGVTATVAANSITTTELAANAVTTNEIVDGTIGNADIADVDVSKITGAPLLDTNSGDDLVVTDVGTGPNQLVRLNGTAQLPAVDGSLLTGVSVTETDPTWTADKTTLGTTGTINNAGNLVDWSQLKGVPTDLADGVDNIGLTTVNRDATLTGDGNATQLGVNVGTSANQIVQLNALGQLPAVDGSLLIGVSVTETDPTWTADKTTLGTTGTINNAGNLVDWSQLKGVPTDLADGVDNIGLTTVNRDATLTGDGNATQLGVNVGTSANQIVQLNGSGQLPAVDGSLLTNLPAQSLTSGSILVGDGTNTAVAQTVSGDMTLSNAGVATIASGAVTGAKIADGTITTADLSVGISGTKIDPNFGAQNITTSGIISGDGSGLTNLPSDGDADPTNEQISNLSFDNITGILTVDDGGATTTVDLSTLNVADADADPTNEQISNLSFDNITGILTVDDGGATTTVDLSTLNVADADADPTNEQISNLSFDNITGILTVDDGGATTTVDLSTMNIADADADPTNEQISNLSFDNITGILTVDDGGATTTVDLSTLNVADADADPTNEQISNLSFDNITGILTVDDGGATTTVDLSTLNVADADADPTNEQISNLSFDNITGILTVDDGGATTTVDLSTLNVADADADPTNEQISNLSFDNITGILTVDDGGATTTVDLSTLNVADADADPTNEQISNLSFDNITGILTVDDGGATTTVDLSTLNVADADADPTNEQISNLSFDNITGILTVDDGGATTTVDLSTMNVADADDDPTNELELPTTATLNDILQFNGTDWVASASSLGDMTQATYDVDTDNVVDTAAVAGNGVPAPSTTGQVLLSPDGTNYAWVLQQAGNVAFDDTDLLTPATSVQQAITMVDARTDSLRKFLGTVAPATSYAAFPGTIIGDNSTIKDAFQDLELATDSLVDLTGVPPTHRDLGFFTGSILESDLDIKQAFQALADTIETRSSSPGGESFAYEDQQFNQFIGPDAGDSIAISGIDNLLVGGRSNVLTIGSGNTIVGQDANVNSSTTSRGTAIGNNAMVHADTATAIGHAAEAFGYGSVALGSSARVTSGAYNAVAIGSRTRAVNPQTIVLGDGVTSPAYRVGIGTNDPRTDLQIGDNFGLWHYVNGTEGIDAQVIAENMYSSGENLYRRYGRMTTGIILENGNFDIMSFGSGAANSFININTEVQPLFELDSIGDAELRGSLRLGSYQGIGGEKPGMMQWNGGTIEVYNGSTWNPLGGGSGGGDSIYTDSNFNQFVGDFSGDSSAMTGSDNLLIGQRSSVLSSGWGNVVVGQDANVYSFSTSRGTALGYRATVDGDTAVAIGNEAQAYSYGSIAIGSNAYVDFGAHNSVALGAGTFVDAPQTVKIGNGTNAQYQLQIGDSLNLFHYENGDIYGEFFTDKIAWDPGSNNLYMTDNGYASAFSINDGFYTFLAANGSQGQYLNPAVDIDTAFIVTPWGDAGIAGGFFLGEMQSTPSASDEGILQYNFTSKELQLWNGTIWESVSGSGAPTGVESLGDFDNNYLIGFGNHDEFGANILAPTLATENIFIGGGRSGNNVLEDGSKNIIIGSQANVMLGAMSGGVALGVASKVSGDNSVAIGHLAEARATNSIAIGYGATNDASGAIALGDGAVTGGSAVNAVAIGSSTYAPNANTIILGDGTNSFFDIGIGVNSPSQKLDVNGNIQSGGVIVGPYDGTIATAPLGAMYFDGSTVQLRTSGGWLPITDGGLSTELFDDNNNLTVGPVMAPGLPGGAYQLGVTGEGASKPFLTASGYGTIPEVRLSRTNGTQASPTAVTNGNPLGEMVFSGMDMGGSYPIAGLIRANAIQNWGNNANLGTELSFRVIPMNGNTPAEVMRMDGQGVVLSGKLVSKPEEASEFSNPPTSRIMKYSGPSVFYNNIGAGMDGQELIIMNINGTSVTFEDLPAGNLQLAGGNASLTHGSTLHLVYSADLSLWLELSRSINQ